MKPASVALRLSLLLHVLQPALVLVGVEAVDHLALADPRPHRAEVLEAGVEGDQAERVLEEHRRHADGGDRPRDRPAAIGTPSMPQRVDSETSATTTTPAVLGCSNSRTISGLKLVSDDCAQSIDAKRSPGLPVAQPDEVEAGAVEQAASARRS